MSTKPTAVTVTLDKETLETFCEATEMVEKAGIRVPIGQLVQTMLNTEIRLHSPQKIAQRFLKSVMQQIGGLSPSSFHEEDETQLPDRSSASR